jgi:hypothetical protein
MGGLMKPIVKKALAAVAAKEIYERIQEAREPRRPSFFVRLFKVGLVAAVLGGAYYAYKNGLFGGQKDRYGTDTYDGSLSYQGPREDLGEQTEPVGRPTT